MTGCFTSERQRPCHHLIQHHPQTPNVCAGIDCLPSRLLRRHVLRRAHYHARICVDQRFCRRFGIKLGRLVFGQLGQSKVQHFHIAIAAQYDVVWLDITVHDA